MLPKRMLYPASDNRWVNTSIVCYVKKKHWDSGSPSDSEFFSYQIISITSESNVIAFDELTVVSVIFIPAQLYGH